MIPNQNSGVLEKKLRKIRIRRKFNRYNRKSFPRNQKPELPNCESHKLHNTMNNKEMKEDTKT